MKTCDWPPLLKQQKTGLLMTALLPQAPLPTFTLLSGLATQIELASIASLFGKGTLALPTDSGLHLTRSAIDWSGPQLTRSATKCMLPR